METKGKNVEFTNVNEYKETMTKRIWEKTWLIFELDKAQRLDLPVGQDFTAMIGGKFVDLTVRRPRSMDNICEGCFFRDIKDRTGSLACPLFACSLGYRRDERDVIFALDAQGAHMEEGGE